MSDSDYTINIDESTNNDSLIINLSGDLTIGNSQSIHKYLLSASFDQKTVTIKIANTDNIDLSIIQLLIGYIDLRRKTDKQTKIEFDTHQNISELIDKTGVTELFSLIQKKK